MGEQRSNPATTENLQKHQKVTAVVELIKDDYLVLSLLDQGNAICFASTGDYNLQVKDAHQRYQPGQRLPATVEELAEEGPGGRILLLLGSFTDPVVTMVGLNKRPRHDRKMEVGSLVDAEVLSVEQLHLILNISKNGKGRVHITEASSPLIFPTPGIPWHWALYTNVQIHFVVILTTFVPCCMFTEH
jgi:rRNA biogenesis protein RRP5